MCRGSGEGGEVRVAAGLCGVGCGECGGGEGARDGCGMLRLGGWDDWDWRARVP